jgi:hypothetical protein
MQSSRDMDIRSPRLSHVGNSSLDRVIRPELCRVSPAYKRMEVNMIYQRYSEEARHVPSQEEGGEERGRDRTGERKLTYQVDVDDGLECVLGETAYGRQAAIKESWFNKPISDSTGSAVGGAYKLPAAPITASREHHYEYHDELCDKRDRTKDPRNRTSSEKGE